MSYCKPFKRGVSWRSQNFGENATIYGPHSGNDDAAPIGTPVHAAGDGYIEWAGEFDDTYLDNLLWLLKMGGNIAVLNCGADAPSFVYGHMHSFTVKRGDWVRKGQVIGYSGNTGTATTGAHLHTEAIPPGYALNSPMLGRVNPDIYLTEWPEDINIGSLSYASESITPLSEEDEMGILDEEITRTGGGPLDGKPTTLRAVIANFDANVHYTREAVKATVAATVSALFNTEIYRAGGRDGVTTFAATLAFLDANIDSLKTDELLDPEKITAAVTAAADKALEGITLTLSNAPGQKQEGVK